MAASKARFTMRRTHTGSSLTLHCNGKARHYKMEIIAPVTAGADVVYLLFGPELICPFVMDMNNGITM